MDAATPDKRLDEASRILDSWGLERDRRDQFLSKQEHLLSLLSIYESLQVIYSENLDRANKWPLRPNRAFDGMSPLEVMLAGNAERVQKYLKYHVYNA